MFKKGLVVIAVPFVFQVVFIVALWKTLKDSAEAQQWAIHTKDVIAQTESVARYLTEAQGIVRGRIVTGDPAMTGTYDEATRRVPLGLDRLREMVRDNPDQQKAVDDLKGKITAFMASIDEVDRLTQGGRVKEASELVRAMARARRTTEIRGLIDQFLREEERLDAIRREQLFRVWRGQYRAIVGGAAASALVAGLTVLAFSKGFARRVAVLGENANRLAEGKALLPPIGGGDELGRLDAAFHGMATALAEKDRENEMFIFSVSHDLRSPLVNLQGFGKELEMSCDDLREALASGDVPDATRGRINDLLDRDMNTSIQFIRTAVTRLSAIIDALLRLSRAGRVEYRWQAVDVAEAVARVVKSLNSTANRRGAEVVVGDLPPAWGDPTAVEQVFANLVGNALNYLDPARTGRVEIGVRHDNTPVGAPGANPITYYVKDNGLGIPEAYQPKLFNAFQRLHPDLADGEGIGLALVRRVVERHGGKIWFESAVQRGSTFYFTLPATSATTPGRASADSAARFEGGKGAQLWPTTH